MILACEPSCISFCCLRQEPNICMLSQVTIIPTIYLAYWLEIIELNVSLQKQKDTLNELASNLISVIDSAREDWEGEQSAGTSRCCVTQCLERHATFVKIRIYCDYIHLINETFSHSLFLFTASRISKTVNPDINTLVSAVTFGKGENIVLSNVWVIPVAQLSHGITVPSNLMNQSQVSPCNQWLVRDHVHARKV